MTQAHFFYIFSYGAVLAALGVILSRSTGRSLIFLAVTSLMIAGLLVSLKSFFSAAALVLVWALVFPVLFFSPVKFISRGKKMSDWKILTDRGWIPVLAFGVSVFFFSQALGVIGRIGPEGPIGLCSCRPPWWKILSPEFVGTTETIGRTVLNRYLVPFGLTSLLILTTVIGSVALTRKNTP